MLRIREIETIPIRVTLNTVYRGSYYRMPRRCTIITRLITEDGVSGEIYNGDADEEQAAIIDIVHKELVPLVVGLEATDTERCWDAMRTITRDQLRDRRLAMQAIACVDSAIWDALGKGLGLPLFKLWGGYRSTLPMIGIGGYYTEDPQNIEREVSFFSEEGFVGMKFKVGGASPSEDVQRLRRAVAVARPGFVFLVDANQGWTVDEAVAFVEEAEDVVKLRWFEEPCEWPNDVQAMRTIRMKTGVEVAAGQSEITRSGMRYLMEGDSIDVSNFDASWGGGPTEWRRVALMAMSFGVSMAHHEEAQISSHLLAAVPHGTYVEGFHPERDPIYWQMLANRPSLSSGEFQLPEGPGFGWKLDPEFIRALPG